MAQRQAFVIDLPSGFQLPELTNQVIFTENLSLRPKGKPPVVIEAGVICNSFYIDGKHHLYIKGWDYLVQVKSFSGFIRLKGQVKANNEVQKVRSRSETIGYMIISDHDWSAKFNVFDSDESEEIGKCAWILENADMSYFILPKIEAMFEKVLRFCEANELYEYCAYLMRWISEVREVNKDHFSKNPILKFCKGYGWVYSNNKAELEQA